MANLDLLLEAERRGILPEDKKPLLDEARRRGLVPGGSFMDKADKFVSETPGLKQAAQFADFLGFGKMAEGVKAIPGAIAGIPGSIEQAIDDPRTLIPTKQDVVNSLPMIGGLAAAPFLGPGAGAVPTMIATGLGTGAGEALKSSIEGKNLPETLGAVKDATVLGAVAGGTPQKAAGIEAPSAIKNTVQLAEKNKLPLSASAINPTKTARAFEWVGESLQPGKAWANMKRQQLQTGLTRMMDEAVGSLPARTEKFDAGVDLSKGLKEAKSGLKASEKAAYGKWEGALGDTGHMMENTVKLLDDMKEGVTGDTRAWLEAYSKKGPGWAASDVDAFQKQIWSKTWGKNVDGGKILEALKKDLGPEMTAVLDEAKESSKLFRAFSSNETVRQVARNYAKDPENVIKEAFQAGNMEDINVIKKALDSETWDIARSRFVENLFDASTDIKGTQRTFNPLKFSKQFAKYQRQIKQVMPEKYDNLEQFAKLSKTAVQDLSKIKLDDTFMSWQTAATSALGGAGAALGNAGMVVPAGFSFAITKSIMNPSGWLKKWLTEGYKMPDFAKKATTVGILKVGQKPAVGREEE